uniref:CCAP-2 n=1 Tax=Charonia tritonis TaxID=1960912 RepID=A0A1S6JQ04_9CAEN|nr:CCAP-2 precursor [Charonia tritonis]
MVSRGHILYVILLPVLARVAADDADEQIMSEMMSGDHDGASNSNSLVRSSEHSSLPRSLILQMLRSGSLRGAASSAPLPAPPAQPLLSRLADKAEYGQDGEVTKRVFCNGFTGCGGRHRDRSRRQERYGKRLIPVLVKRPFCNSFGCYNGKRSSSSFSIVDPVAAYRARVFAQMMAAAESARRGEEGERPAGVVVPGKRLFCNGYGGCRGGKRSLFSPWMSKLNGVVGEGM